MNRQVRVLRAGLMTTVQDLGRPATRHWGVPVGGAMDQLSHRLANRLVGNSDTAATLEMTLTGDVLQWEQDAVIAITGASLRAVMESDNRPEKLLMPGRPWFVPAGSRIQFGTVQRGCRSYLAVSGGWDVPIVLGSRSTLQRSQLGGHCGRALRAGDILTYADAPESLTSRISASRSDTAENSNWYVQLFHPPAATGTVLRFLPGTHFPRLTNESQKVMQQSEFAVRMESDRMGYRLHGLPLRFSESLQIRSEAVIPGTLQLPPDGQLLLLMADCAPTGGYPRVGHIISADLPLAAQLKPGDRFSLCEVSLLEAQEALRLQEQQLAAAVHLARLNSGV